MSKYDYGYKLVDGTTTAWAYEKINPGSVVLEFGPAIGNLAKHLHEEKGCTIDIVELDEEDGTKAARFARTSILGKEGDLNTSIWYEKLLGNYYDYIVILDVLEHVYDSESLLKLARKLLKENGKVLISMPNIAHNSILINLFNNKFVYTKDGLLDDTHIKFYTYSTFCNLLCKCKYKIICKEAKQIPVGMNEVNASYDDVPPDVEVFLRTRPLSDVYQFLFIAQKNEKLEEGIVDDIEFCPTTLNETLYKLQIYFDGKAENVIDYFCNPSKIDISIKIEKRGYKYIRIDPVEYKCILQILKVEGKTDQDTVNLNIYETNGIGLDNNIFIFPENDPNFCVALTDDINEIRLSCQCFEVNSKYMNVYSAIVYKQNSNLQLLQQYKGENESLKENMLLAKQENETLQKDVLLGKQKTESLKEEILSEKQVNRSLKEEILFKKQENESLKEEILFKKQENESLKEEISLKKQENELLGEKARELEQIQKKKIYRIFMELKILKERIWGEDNGG